MKLRIITEWAEINIQSYNPDDDLDGIGERCYHIANESGIRISREKDLTLVALAGSEPVGAVWSSFKRDDDASEHHGQEIYCFDFDVAVTPASRATGMGSPKVGPQLIEAALDHYRSLRSEVDGAYIRVWVVNPKLARYLENKYGFETDGREWSLDSPHLSYYGK